jgi:hypothetical protein
MGLSRDEAWKIALWLFDIHNYSPILVLNPDQTYEVLMIFEGRHYKVKKVLY